MSPLWGEKFSENWQKAGGTRPVKAIFFFLVSLLGVNAISVFANRKTQFYIPQLATVALTGSLKILLFLFLAYWTTARAECVQRNIAHSTDGVGTKPGQKKKQKIIQPSLEFLGFFVCLFVCCCFKTARGFNCAESTPQHINTQTNKQTNKWNTFNRSLTSSGIGSWTTFGFRVTSEGVPVFFERHENRCWATDALGCTLYWYRGR